MKAIIFFGFTIALSLSHNSFAQSNTITDGLEWVGFSTVTQAQSPSFSGITCEGIQYTISTTSDLGFRQDTTMNPSPDHHGVFIPGAVTEPDTLMEVSITFNNPVLNFGMRITQFNEGSSNVPTDPIEYIYDITPPPASVNPAAGFGPLFYNGSVLTPSDGDINSDNDGGAWLRWSGEFTTVHFMYSREFPYKIILDTIQFECMCNPPVFPEITDTVICANEEITLDLTTPGYYYLWHNGDTTPVQTFSSTQEIWATVYYENCQTHDSMQLTVNPMPSYIQINDTIICEDSDLPINLDATNNPVYNWSNGTAGNSVLLTEPGQYSVVGSIGDCSVHDTFELQLYPGIDELDFESDLLKCTYKELLIGPETSIIQIIWSDGWQQSPRIVQQSGNYFFTAVTPCENEQFQIEVREQDCFCEFYLPNAFTPDNNSLNNSFQPQSVCIPDEFNLTIFNRWGEMVFVSVDPASGWDGTYRNNPVPDGIYNYSLSYKHPETSTYVQKSGFVTLIR